MKANFIETISTLLLIALLLIPVLRMMLASRSRVPRPRIPTGDEDMPSTKVRRQRKLGSPPSHWKPGTPEAVGAASQENDRRVDLHVHEEIAQALATLHVGAAGLRQGIVLATILAPPGGMSEAHLRAPGRSPRFD